MDRREIIHRVIVKTPIAMRCESTPYQHGDFLRNRSVQNPSAPCSKFTVIDPRESPDGLAHFEIRVGFRGIIDPSIWNRPAPGLNAEHQAFRREF